MLSRSGETILSPDIREKAFKLFAMKYDAGCGLFTDAIINLKTFLYLDC